MQKINFSHNLLGCRFDNWLRLKRTNPIQNKDQARLITLVSFLLWFPALAEWLLFYLPIKRTKIKKGPVYIVGTWRSGTTYLQNLLTRDPQFGWFDPVKTVSFSNCILMKYGLAKIQKRLLKGARPMDNLEYTLDLPMEEVFAHATISDQTVSHMLVFPDGGRGTKYIATSFSDELGRKEHRRWHRSYDYMLRKVTYLCKGRQLLLKSPENTCRIGELKRCYPEAKFIDIYRNPYKVILSTMHMFTKEMDMLCLNEPASPEVIEEVTISFFERMYKKAMADMEGLSPKDCIHIKYEDFCTDPKGYLKQIYDQLGLDGYEEALPYFETYLESQKNYQKNEFSLEKPLRDKINSRLGFYFRHYQYDMITD